MRRPRPARPVLQAPGEAILMYQFALSVLVPLQAMRRPGNSARFRAGLLNYRYRRNGNSQKPEKFALRKEVDIAAQYNKNRRKPEGIYEHGGPAQR
jgi:hypothetical protein